MNTILGRKLTFGDREQIAELKRIMRAIEAREKSCDLCGGSGLIEKECDECGGTGENP